MSENKFGMLRRVLRAIGLSQQSSDDVVDFIVEIMAGEKQSGGKSKAEFPYRIRDEFLSAAELNFYGVLRTTLNPQVTTSAKVCLRDVFYVTKHDASQFRVYTNKIDRKHVDFLICDSATMRPLVGIELDDKSHQRKDRQERDAFVDEVFHAAGLPLVHVPAKRAYRIEDITTAIAPHLDAALKAAPVTPTTQIVEEPKAPVCPKCGSPMILRTVRKGDNAGNKFWGCSTYPTCRGIVPYEA